jgi:hypothetical protein
VPAEVYFGIRNHVDAVGPPPRAAPGVHAPPAPFTIAFLDPDTRSLPVLLANVA